MRAGLAAAPGPDRGVNVLAAERLHGGRHHGADPWQGQTVKGRHLDLCTRRRPFGGRTLRRAVFMPRGTGRHEHPVRSSSRLRGPISKADAYDGTMSSYESVPLRGANLRRRFAGRTPGGSSLNWPDIAPMPRRWQERRQRSRRCMEAVRRIDVLFDIERGNWHLNGLGRR